MKISVILHSTLREKLPPEARGRTVLELKPGSSVSEVFTRLDLPEGFAWALNGNLQRDQTIQLDEGDEIRIFRVGAGGRFRVP